MNVRRLKMFVTVAEELHFGRAAERLFIAQPPLSQQIRLLEQELGVTLFARNSRNVSLTREGEVLLRAARRVLAEADSFESLAATLAAGDAGLLRLGFVTSAATHYVPALVKALRAQAPDVQLQLQEFTTEEQVARIAAGELDAGIAREVLPSDPVRLAASFEEPLLLAVPEGHRLAGQTSVGIQELAGEGYVSLPQEKISRLYARIGTLFDDGGIAYTTNQVANQFLTILGLVASGVGIAIVPTSMEHAPTEHVRFLRIVDSRAFSSVSYITSIKRSPLSDRFVTVAQSLAQSKGEQ